jgi:predicted RNA-binding protein YlqC (UPF0109 family)
MRYLHRVVKGLRTDYCLIGGWAVLHLCGRSYEAEYGRPYLGSRDIDIGLSDVESFRRAEHYILNDLDFERISFRYLRYLDYETGKELTSEEAKKIPSYGLIPMYIDAMLPEVDARVIELLGFTPPDEPLLDRVFHEPGSARVVNVQDRRVKAPKPAILLAMKLNSVGNRSMDHKRIKDLCDIAALCLHSGEDMAVLIHEAISICDRLKLVKARASEEDVAQVFGATGIPVQSLKTVLGAIGMISSNGPRKR